MSITTTSPIYISLPEKILPISFVATDEQSQPIADRPYTVMRNFKTTYFAPPHQFEDIIADDTSPTGAASFTLQTGENTGSYNSVTINVDGGATIATVPTAIYNANEPASVIVDNASYSDGKIIISLEEVEANGLSIMVNVPARAQKDEIFFLSIGSFFTYYIAKSETSTAVFNLPPSPVVPYPFEENNVLFYGIIHKTGNCTVPNLSELVIQGIEPSVPLTAPLVQSTGGEYINVTANTHGVRISIPSGQDDIKAGDTYQMVYALGTATSAATTITSGTVAGPDPYTTIEFTTESDYFPKVSETKIWFWYVVTSSTTGQKRSVVVSRILDTLE